GRRRDGMRREPAIIRPEFELVTSHRKAHCIHEIPLILGSKPLRLIEPETEKSTIKIAKQRLRASTQPCGRTEVHGHTAADRINKIPRIYVVRGEIEAEIVGKTTGEKAGDPTCVGPRG